MAAEASARLNTVRDWLSATVDRFNEAGLFFGHGSSNAHDEAVYLILHTLKLPLDELDSVLGRPLTPGKLETLESFLPRRVDERAPAAYLTREAWLGEFRFYVDERVIIPRSYIAELLRDELYPWIGDDQSVDKALDLCTGSGCLAILLALAFPDAEVDATELSAEALEVAARNIADYQLQDRVQLVRGDLFAGLSGRYDLIVSNPPYVNGESMENLRRQIHDDETHAHQAAHLQSQRLEHAPHDPVPTFLQNRPVPAVTALAALILQQFELRVAIGKPYAAFQLLHLCRGQAAEQAHRIFAFDLETRMHKTIGQFTLG